LALPVRIAVAAVLALAALSKLRSPRSAGAGLATFGIPRPLQLPATVALAAVEGALAVAVAAGSDGAAYAAAGLFAIFGAALGVALARGRAGAPCACFGARSRVSRVGIARNLVLAVAFAALPWLPDSRLSTEGWLALGLLVCLAGLAALGVATFALAREVGLLRLQVAPQAALEVPGEGPRLGERNPLRNRFTGAAPLALAVFTSEGCALCRSLAPSVAAFGRDPHVELLVFDEVADADAWDDAAAPGSPYAVALDRDGIVRAKGTFNNAAQLEGILAAAERRAAHV
jgi:hypothetical protein